MPHSRGITHAGNRRYCAVSRLIEQKGFSLLLSCSNCPRLQNGELNYMQQMTQWLTVNGSTLAVLVTVGVAVLLVCCLECTKCGCREKDDLFNRHEV